MTDKWLIFDAMGVIFEVGDDVSELLVPFVRERNPLTAEEAIFEWYLKTSRGEVSSEEFWVAVGLGDQYPAVEKEYLDAGPTVDPEFRDVAIELKRSYKLAVLSNDVREWAEYLYAKHRLDYLFDVMVISGAVGCRKPGKEIFEHFLRWTGTNPADCLFVEDNPKNLAAASQLGFRTIRFIRQNPTEQGTDRDTMEWMSRLTASVQQKTAADGWNGRQVSHFRELLDLVRR